MFEVLLIDDNVDLRTSLVQTIELAGFDVTAYESAKLALAELSPEYTGVVLSDIKMPGMDGLSLLKKTLKLDDGIPIVLMTGHGDISTAVSAMKMGAYDFLEKPFRKERLIDILYRAAEKRKLVLENRQLRSQLHVGNSEVVDLNQALPQRVDLYEKYLIEKVLAEHKGSIQKSYLSLQIPRKTLYDKLAKHKIDQSRFRS